jgi:putative nucleotidyltransferase with HDIG domain
MHSDLARAALAESVTIPTLPSVVQRINQMLDDPDASLRDVGREIAQDAPISSKLLRLANSAVYGTRERVLSAEHAASVLGMRVVRNLVMQSAVIAKFEHLRSVRGFDFDGLWRHAIVGALIARDLTKRARVKLSWDPEEAYTCALLHDIGKVVLLDGAPEPYAALIHSAAVSGRPLYSLERDLIGLDHAEVGARVLEHWGLDESLITVVRNHHAPKTTLLRFPALCLVALADQTATRVALDKADEVREGLEGALGRALGIEDGQLEAAIEFAFQAHTEVVV